MCGIHGIVDPALGEGGGEEMLALLRAMGRAQGHRGPDGHAERVFGSGRARAGLGFVRLAILDLESGMQPIVRPQDGAAIVCNGQIYNYRALRKEIDPALLRTHGDIEVALHLYARHGTAFLDRLNGMYAGAIFDPAHRRLLLFTDRFGVKPLYYAAFGGRFCFASEIKALRAAAPGALRVNQAALAPYLTFGYVPGEETLYAGVRRLAPGSFLAFDLDTGTFSTHRYWRYAPATDATLDLPRAAERFFELFEDAVALRAEADVTVGATVSGGIDSCAVAALAARRDPAMPLFTLAFDDPAYDESARATDFIARVPNAAGTHPVHVATCGPDVLQALPAIMRHLEEPVCKTALLPTWRLFERVSRQVKVVLTGEGADELFAGYGWFWLDAAGRRTGAGGDPLSAYTRGRRFFEPDELAALLGAQRTRFDIPADLTDGVPGDSAPLEALLTLETRFRLPAANLLRLDKLAMAHSVEARTPFLDFRLAELAGTLSADLKLGARSEEQKFVCRSAFARRGLLPPGVAWARKQPLSAPVDAWLRDEAALPEPLQDVLAGRHAIFGSLVDPRPVRRLREALRGEATTPFSAVTAADKLWALCVLAAWHDAALRTQ